MVVFMAGATKMGIWEASTVLVSRLSAKPSTSFANVLAVRGAINISVAFSASSMCSGRGAWGCQKSASVSTDRRHRVERVNGVMNCEAVSERMADTCHPAFTCVEITSQIL